MRLGGSGGLRLGSAHTACASVCMVHAAAALPTPSRKRQSVKASVRPAHLQRLPVRLVLLEVKFHPIDAAPEALRPALLNRVLHAGQPLRLRARRGGEREGLQRASACCCSWRNAVVLCVGYTAAP